MRHELTNRGDELFDRLIVTADFAFELIKLACQIFVSEYELPQLHERSHHKDADFDRSRRIQDTGRHEGTVFGKSIWQVSSTAATDI